MSQELWTAVDQYIGTHLVPPDHALDEALRASAAAGLPAISVSPAQGKFLHLLARVQNARKILEIGTLGGYSTIWLARALPQGGRLVSLEVNPKHVSIAKENLRRAGVDHCVDLRLGPALETLPALAAEGLGPFDFTFIDADKPATAEYFDWALRLSRPGGLIIVDNVVRKGAVIDAASTAADVQGVRLFYERLSAEPRATGTVIQTVGSKGHDGFALIVVN